MNFSSHYLMKFPRDMTNISLHHFRRVMCSNKYTVEQKDTAFEGLTQDYFRCELEDPDVLPENINPSDVDMVAGNIDLGVDVIKNL